MADRVLPSLFVQSETIRGEGVWHYVEAMTPRAQAALRAYPYEAAFVGRGAKQKAEKALRDIQKLEDV